MGRPRTQVRAPRPLDDGAKVGWGLLAMIASVGMVMAMTTGVVIVGLRKVLQAWRAR